MSDPLRQVYLSLDGVTYRHGHRAPIEQVLETDAGPGPESARALAEAALEALTGDDLQLRAGWLSLRWLAREGEGWEGPGYLFSFESETPGSYELEATGEDAEEWPLE